MIDAKKLNVLTYFIIDTSALTSADIEAVTLCANRWIPLIACLSMAIFAIAEESRHSVSCSTNVAMLSANYPTANMGQCKVLDETHFMLQLLPEDKPINPSPWYGFKVNRFPGYEATNVKVSLFYAEFEHRYRPKFSVDGTVWKLLPSDHVATVAANHVELTIPQKHKEIYISARESFGNDRHEEWLTRQLDRWPSAEILTLGYSHGKRPIRAFVTNRPAQKIILLLGRAHPPEVSGAIAFQDFVERLFTRRSHDCATRLPACQFFLDHQFILVPNLNPDGVALGYWRHNLDSTDLNRDWGRFNQPETSSIHRYLMQELKSGDVLALMLDFHSTRRNVLYTQTENDNTSPAHFARKWFAAREKYGTEPFMEHAPREFNPELGTSKNYFFDLAGVPSITFELGDNTTRNDIEAISVQFADALIDVLLSESTYSTVVPTENRDFFYLMMLANSASLIALTEQGYIPLEESVEIQDAQLDILQEVVNGTRATSSNYLDLEEALIAKLGSSASNVHLGRSRQDLHGITRRMLARESLLQTMTALVNLIQKLNTRSRTEISSAIPMFTHGVPAHPTTLGHQLQAFSRAFDRDFARLEDAFDRLNLSQLGSMAGVGSSMPLNRERLANLLAFSGDLSNSFDANFLSTSDYKLEIAQTLSTSALHVAMFVENIHSPLRDSIPWIYLDEKGTSISSSMPQKQNPRPLDRLRTTANNVIGKAQIQSLRSHNVETGMHDYRSVNLLLEQMGHAHTMYNQLSDLIDLIQINDERAVEVIQLSHVLSSSLVEVLYEDQGTSVRDSHTFIRELISIARTKNRSLIELPDTVFASVYEKVFDKKAPVSLIQKLKNRLNLEAYFSSRQTSGGPNKEELIAQIEEIDRRIATSLRWLNIQYASIYAIEENIRRVFNNFRKK